MCSIGITLDSVALTHAVGLLNLEIMRSPIMTDEKYLVLMVFEFFRFMCVILMEAHFEIIKWRTALCKCGQLAKYPFKQYLNDNPATIIIIIFAVVIIVVFVIIIIIIIITITLYMSEINFRTCVCRYLPFS
jgi:hypothetical protein